MRDCPICQTPEREEIWRMSYKIPDGWPLMSEIVWYACEGCGLVYGDGDFDQAMLDDYYLHYYGYGLGYEDNIARLTNDANTIAGIARTDDVIVDFGGGKDSVVITELKRLGFNRTISVDVGDPMPKADIIFASHVLEHIYTLPATMELLVDALKPEGTLIVDGPDATGLLLKWNMPILDFNTKHIQHFTLRDYLNLGWRYGLEMVDHFAYDLGFIRAGYQIRFKKMDIGVASMGVIKNRTYSMKARLLLIDKPVNVWGMNDLAWHMLAAVDLDVLDYIDNDPAYRGKTYNGKPVLERPTNDAPILIMVQGQRQRLIENIRKAGITNEIIEL